MFSCKPKLIQSITPNHKCRALLLSMWHLTRRQALLIGLLDPWRFYFSKPMTIVTDIHGGVPDLLLVVLRYVTGTYVCGAKEISAYGQGFLCLTDTGCTLGKMVACRNISVFYFPLWYEERSVGLQVAGAEPSCSLLQGSFPSAGARQCFLPWDRLRFTLWLVLPMCKIGNDTCL